MSTFKCPHCKNIVGVPTRKWKFRKRGARKAMWCFRCRRKTNHVML